MTLQSLLVRISLLPCEDFLALLSVLPFFSKGFGGSAKRKVLAFNPPPILTIKQQGLKRQRRKCPKPQSLKKLDTESQLSELLGGSEVRGLKSLANLDPRGHVHEPSLVEMRTNVSRQYPNTIRDSCL